MTVLRNCLNCNKEYIPFNQFSQLQKYCGKKCADKYYAKLHPKVRQKAWRKYNETHREEQKIRTRKYYYENREKMLAYRKEHQLENSARTRAKLIAKKNMEKVCFDCHSDKNIHVHHKDFNAFNNDLSNLIYVCSICHGKRHQK